MNNPNVSPDDPLVRRKRSTIGFFDRVAVQYDRTGPRFFTYFGRQLVEAAQIGSGERVLDIAAGRGAVLFPALEAVGPGGNVIGVDLSAQMVAELSQEVQGLGLSNVRILEMDAEKLEFPDATFDVVLVGFALFFFPQLAQALAEIRRVLKPGGRIAVSTWDASMDKQWEVFFGAAQSHIAAYAPEKSVPFRPPSNNVESVAGLAQTLQSAGFGDVQVVYEEHDFVYPSFEAWWAALWTHWTRMALERVEQTSGAEGLARFQQDLYQKMETIRQPDGIHQIFPALIGVGRKPVRL